MASSDRMENINAITQPKKRTAAACRSCHTRKVRCSLAQTGSPCTNCSLDGITCEARVSRIPPGREQLSQLDVLVKSLNDSSSRVKYRRECQAQAHTGSPNSEDLTSRPQPPEADGDCYKPGSPYRLLTEHFRHYGTEETLDQESHDTETLTPIYGDPRGVALVADICEPQLKNKSGHYLVPPMVSANIGSETMDYLRRKGVFDLPPPIVCVMMIKTYFRYVHPFFPIIEPRSFLELYESNERENLSLQLLWSIFLAAANFADQNTLEAAGFSSRKKMKHAMYTKAKARISVLYDTEYERKRITLIQSVLLMEFWYSDTEDRTGPWYWNGIAISLCHTIGLHRQPDTGTDRMGIISSQERRLWRQIWWCCVYRETWFSAGMGRPMRINLADCNTSMPDSRDSNNLLSGITDEIRLKYLPDDCGYLLELWIELLRITSILSRILSVQQCVKRTLHTRVEVEEIERQLRAVHYRVDNLTSRSNSRIASLHLYHLEIYSESVLLTLYRPFLLETSEMNTEACHREWGVIVERKTRAAAINTNAILSKMIRADMINECLSMICIALVPTLQIHLLDCVSLRLPVQRLGNCHLDLCMIVVEELKTTYFGAEILFRMFSGASRHTTTTAEEQFPQFSDVWSPYFNNEFLNMPWYV
ncbi:fungal-specific transcription factor domain-containing protein [Talaromyces proteolyticus]|uniref:Fungal-specific transcription factor domain-containing protein n=1 Tax=Talaromyces proteolyticus TaxID=1131652 RepID=A0AAD4L385_9EURO|nr:fungal-specific transcription factor domain-containing protein [Talaromyces proteolyticus]KAH8702404.1 fungal-specific transcription factor domain-containing protein [Talaromyces proteolyticus]